MQAQLPAAAAGARQPQHARAQPQTSGGAQRLGPALRQRLNSALEQSKKLNEEIENVRKNAEEQEKKIVAEIPPKPAVVEAPAGDATAQQAAAIKAAVDEALKQRMSSEKPNYFEMLRNAQFSAAPVGETKFYGTLEEQLALGRAIFSKDK